MVDFNIHECWAEKHGKAFERLIQTGEHSWVVVIVAYYQALHFVEASAAKESNSHFKTHKERLDYLAEKSLFIKKCFDRLHILSMFVIYGEQGDVELLRGLLSVFTRDNFVEVIQAWVSAVERISQK
jgi:hypothetical protein